MDVFFYHAPLAEHITSVRSCWSAICNAILVAVSQGYVPAHAIASSGTQPPGVQSVASDSWCRAGDGTVPLGLAAAIAAAKASAAAKTATAPPTTPATNDTRAAGTNAVANRPPVEGVIDLLSGDEGDYVDSCGDGKAARATSTVDDKGRHTKMVCATVVVQDDATVEEACARDSPKEKLSPSLATYPPNELTGRRRAETTNGTKRLQVSPAAIGTREATVDASSNLAGSADGALNVGVPPTERRTGGTAVTLNTDVGQEEASSAGTSNSIARFIPLGNPKQVMDCSAGAKDVQ